MFWPEAGFLASAAPHAFLGVDRWPPLLVVLDSPILARTYPVAALALLARRPGKAPLGNDFCYTDNDALAIHGSLQRASWASFDAARCIAGRSAHIAPVPVEIGDGHAGTDDTFAERLGPQNMPWTRQDAPPATDATRHQPIRILTARRPHERLGRKHPQPAERKCNRSTARSRAQLAPRNAGSIINFTYHDVLLDAVSPIVIPAVPAAVGRFLGSSPTRVRRDSVRRACRRAQGIRAGSPRRFP